MECKLNRYKETQLIGISIYSKPLPFKSIGVNFRDITQTREYDDNLDCWL